MHHGHLGPSSINKRSLKWMFSTKTNVGYYSIHRDLINSITVVIIECVVHMLATGFVLIKILKRLSLIPWLIKLACDPFPPLHWCTSSQSDVLHLNVSVYSFHLNYSEKRKAYFISFDWAMYFKVVSTISYCVQRDVPFWAFVVCGPKYVKKKKKMKRGISNEWQYSWALGLLGIFSKNVIPATFQGNS